MKHIENIKKHLYSINLIRNIYYFFISFLPLKKEKKYLINGSPRIIELDCTKRNKEEFPKIIWSYWVGEKSSCAEACIKSIKIMNSEFEINIINKDNLYDFLPDFPELNERISVQHFSDLVRLMLLEKYGGIWIDYSTILTASLEWVPETLEKYNAEAILFYNEFPDEYLSDHTMPIVENGFIASHKKSEFIKEWKKNYLYFLEIEKNNNLLKNHDFIKYTKNFIDKSDKTLTYLKCHVAAQKTIGEKKYCKLVLINCEDDYFSFYYKTSPPRNKRKFAEELLIVNYEDQEVPKLIKITGGHRKRIDEYIKNNCYKKYSLLGKYIS